MPFGVVTFVFTDIEGSTKLLRRWGLHYADLLERHRLLLRAAWRGHGGVEVAADGDAFFVAFDDADAAIEACAAAQRLLGASGWPSEGEVRVRVGIHAGLAWPRGDNYVALAVHQAARVVSAAHGGQVIATSDVVERSGALVRHAGVGESPSDEPERTELRSLGRFRIRDFDEPVQLFQVVGPGLQSEFPPLRVLPADRHNLVAQPNELLGRDADLDRLGVLVGRERLVTVVGPGGVGKTRLVTEFGLRHANEWNDGIWLVDLTGVGEGDLVSQAVADAVGAKVEGNDQPWEAVLEHLRARRSVLIVDNCEHLRVDVAKLVHSLLGACPGVHVLATSRESLGLRAECVIRAEPLDLDVAAVILFTQRAGLGSVGDLDSNTRSTLRELCRVLDGLPLAIELAASRCDVMTPAEMLSQLQHRRDLLRSQDPTLAARQRSMQATIEWSYNLLTGHEQAAFRRLGVFVDGFDLDAAISAVAIAPVGETTVGDGISPYDAPELVWSLVAKSLVTSELASGSTRYRMLESIRHVAQLRLDGSGEVIPAAVGVTRHFLDRFGPSLERSDAGIIADRAREAHNLRGLIAAIAMDEPELAQTLACAVVADARQTSFSAAIVEGRDLLDQLPARTQARVALLQQVAFLLDETQRPEEAEPVLALAESLAQEVGVPPWLEGRLEQERGMVELLRGNPVRARELALEGLGRVTGSRGRASVLELQMLAAVELGHITEAIAAGDEALALTQKRGDLEISSLLLASLAEAAWRGGDHAAAARRQLESLSLGLQTGRRRDIAYGCIMAARIGASQGVYEAAVRLQSAADRLLVEAGVSLYSADSRLRDELLETCRQRIGAVQFEVETERGRELNTEDAVKIAFEVLQDAARVESPQAGPEEHG